MFKLIGIFNVTWFLWTYAKIFKYGCTQNTILSFLLR